MSDGGNVDDSHKVVYITTINIIIHRHKQLRSMKISKTNRQISKEDLLLFLLFFQLVAEAHLITYMANDTTRTITGIPNTT